MRSPSSDILTLLVRIEGRVQGVWFRGWTVAEATRRELSGWVRNRSDAVSRPCSAASGGRSKRWLPPAAAGHRAPR